MQNRSVCQQRGDTKLRRIMHGGAADRNPNIPKAAAFRRKEYIHCERAEHPAGKAHQKAVPPRVSPANTALKHAVTSADGRPRQSAANMTAILERPSLAPGTGTGKSGSIPSNADSTTAAALTRPVCAIHKIRGDISFLFSIISPRYRVNPIRFRRLAT